jgi:ADP-heptose:LPS heptosyltransferase
VDPEPIERVFYSGIYGYRDDVRSILLVKLDHIGDFVQAIPAFYLLNKCFPNADIDIMLGPWNRKIAEATGIFRNIFSFDYYKEKSGEGRNIESGDAEIHISQILEGLCYDVAIDYRPDGDTRSLLKFVHANLLAGFSRSTLYPWLNISVEWEGNVKLWRKNLNGSLLLKRLSQAVADAFSEGDEINNSNLMTCDNSNSSCILIHPFAGNEIKLWPEDYWISLCSSLPKEFGLPVVVIGSSRDKIEYVDFISNLKKVGVIDKVGEVSIAELPRYMSNASCFIGVDSGPKHLASAIGIPSIAIQSGFVDPVVWAPINAPGLSVIKKTFCSPCYLDDIALCSENHRCMSKIYPGDILRVLLSYGFLKKH